MSTQPTAGPIPIDFYKGAYGPTIRIDAQTADALKVVLDIFKALAGGATTEVLLTSGPSFRLSGHDFVRLRLEDDGRTTKCLRRVRVHSGTGVGFEWTCDRDGWTRCVALVGRLFQHNPGHQYLTDEGKDDALVELAYREPAPSGQPSGMAP
jgi:hypothetical protein